MSLFFFFLNDPATTEIYTLPLHDALPIFARGAVQQTRPEPVLECFDMLADHASGEVQARRGSGEASALGHLGEDRSEEHTSELQSPCNLVCRLLLEKKKNKHISTLSDSIH